MKDRRLLTFIGPSLYYFIGDVIVALISMFFIIPLLVKSLGSGGFGEFVYTRSAADILLYLLALGIPTGYSRFFYDYSRKEQVALFYGSILLATTIAVFIALLSFFKFPISLFAVGMSWSAYIYNLYATYLQLNGRHLGFAVVKISGVSITFLLLLGLSLRPSLFENYYLLAFSLNILGLAVPLIRLNNSNEDVRKTWVLGNILKLIKFSFPILLGYIFYFFYNKSSVMFLKIYDEMESIATLGITLQLALVIFLTGGALGKFYQPYVYRENIKTFWNIMALYYVVVMFFVTLIVVFFGKILYSFVIKDIVFMTDADSALIFCATFLLTIKTLFDTQILLYKRPKYSMYTSIIGGSFALVVYSYTGDGLSLTMVAKTMFASSLVMTLTSFIFAIVSSKANYA